MELQEYAQRIVDTTQEEWTIITCWGFGAGPSYLQATPEWTTEKGTFQHIEIESHGMRASLKSDLSIGIAWGLSSNPDFKESWANQFSDPGASSGFVDFFYNGLLVFRDIYVHVDGAQCRLPLPDRKFDPETHKLVGYTVPKDKYTFFKMLDGFEQVSEFGRYFGDAGFKIVDVPWMI